MDMMDILSWIAGGLAGLAIGCVLTAVRGWHESRRNREIIRRFQEAEIRDIDIVLRRIQREAEAKIREKGRLP